jgi:RNA polymerase sigma-70 factor (ECF subfamily)
MSDPRETTPDARFLRWRRTGEPDELAAVFDATAPGLLRLGIHLVGRAGEAEDLVQASFLAAIERPEAFDPARGDVAAWLSGILARKARAAHRAGARAPDPERLPGGLGGLLGERLARTPFDEVLDVELSGALAEALDRVDEPYRAALVLRLRHGLAPADVAHALGLSPGAARTRLSRGMEKLRRLLPPSLAVPGIAFGAESAARGLAAVRAVVLERAGAVAATAGASTLTFGGILMVKKLLIAGGALVALAAVLLWNALDHGSTRDGDASASRVATIAARMPEAGGRSVARDDASLHGFVDAAERVEITAVSRTPPADLVALNGNVVDAASGEPIAGAEVLLVAARRAAPSSFRDDPTVRTQLYGSGLFPYGAVPLLEGDPVEIGAQLDTITPRVFGTPSATDLAEPLARAVSASDGAFRMDVPHGGGTLVCRHPSYPTRVLPAPHPERTWTIALRRTRTLAGTVIDDATGAPVDEEVELVFWGVLGTEWRVDPRSNEVSNEVVEGDARFAAAAHTDARGRFSIDLPLERAQVEIKTAGWSQNGGKWLAPGGAPVEVRVLRAPFLHVVDARTGAPLETIHLLKAPRLGITSWCTELYGRGGRYQLARNSRDIDLEQDEPVDLVVWSDGYRHATRRVEDFRTAGAIEIELEPGALPAVTGHVLLGGVPAADAQVLLLAQRPRWSTRLDEARPVDGMRTDAAGHFVLSAPPGSYVLRVAAGGRAFAEPIELPEEGVARSVDLLATGAVEVTVMDTDGTLRADHTVLLCNDSKLQEWKATDEQGRAWFDTLRAGEYEVRVPHVSTHGSFNTMEMVHVTARDGATARVTVTVPSDRPRYAVLVAYGESDATRFRARAWQLDWTPVEPGGRIPIDLAKLSFNWLDLEHADGRRWDVDLPRPAPDGYRIEVALDGPAYEGRIVDRATGAPLGGLWVQGYPILSSDADAARMDDHGAFPTPRLRADADGRFRLVSRAAVPHHLSFAAGGPDDFGSLDHEYGGTALRTLGPPGGDPIEIRLPRSGAAGVPSRVVTGVVRRAVDGTPADGAVVWMRAEETQPAGRLSLLTQDARAIADAEGAFEVRVPMLAELVVQLAASDGAPFSVTIELSGDAARVMPLELVMP